MKTYTLAEIRIMLENRWSGTIDADVLDFVARCVFAQPALDAWDITDLVNHIHTARAYGGRHIAEAESTIHACELPQSFYEQARQIISENYSAS